MSDHRPVAADFSIEVYSFFLFHIEELTQISHQFDLYEKAEYETTVRRLYREVHTLDGSHERPVIKVDQSYVDFGEIRYVFQIPLGVTSADCE